MKSNQEEADMLFSKDEEKERIILWLALEVHYQE